MFVDYDFWFEALRGTAVLHFEFTPEMALNFDKKIWFNYYDEGMTPHEALTEDFSERGSNFCR